MKKRTVLLICIIVIIISVFIFFWFKKGSNSATTSKYSEKATIVMKEYKIYDKVIKESYSKTVEVLLEKGFYKDEYFKEYLNIVYKEDIKDFASLINKLLAKDYNAKEVNYILSNYINQLDIILDMKHFNILDFDTITNYKEDYLERYLNYQKNHEEYDLKTVVTFVNIGLDLEGYSKYTTYSAEEVSDNIGVLVNKYHKLPDEYEPSDLVSISGTSYLLRKEASEAYEKLKSAAILDNVYFYPFSAYRSFATQNGLYNMYKKRDGEKLADTYSARPGFSEHQLGLAIDIRSSSLPDNLTQNDYNWMLNNAHKYGFIIRYPKGKQYVTQYMEEPWHIRYLGVDLATKVHDSGLTFDEYYDIYLDK